MLGLFGTAKPGELKVVVTNGQHHSIDAWAELCVNHLIVISDTAPDVLRQQAHHARSRMLRCVSHYLNEALKAHDQVLADKLAKHGQTLAAQIIKES